VPGPLPRGLAIVRPTGSPLADLLRSRRSLAAAFLLREILGPPVCRRRLTGR
jgi:hypothetical protein